MRYSRQEILKEIGKSGQEKISASSVAIIGVGALGSTCAELLTRAGVGKLTLVDRDIIELTNLQRQNLYEEKDLGKPKAIVAKEALQRINSKVKIMAYFTDISFKNIDSILGSSSLILDCTDNLQTRFLLNEYCIKKKKPWIHASAVSTVGAVNTFMPGKPCFRCVFREAANLDTCDTSGVLNTITNAISSFQVNEAIKVIVTGKGSDGMIRLDIWENQLLVLKSKKNPKCPACAGKFEYLNGKKGNDIIKFCGSGNFQIKGKPQNLKLLKKKLSNHGEVRDLEYALIFQNMTVFDDGRVLIKAKEEKDAKSVYNRWIGG